MYDGHKLEHDLEIDKVYLEMRIEIINTLLKLGYTEKQLLSKDFAREIIENPQKIEDYIKDPKEAERIRKLK